MKYSFFFAITIFLFFNGFCQTRKKNIDQTPLWQIKDPVSGHISYLFGTEHIVGASWLDSVTDVKDKFQQSKHVFVEAYQEKPDTNQDKLLMQSVKGPVTDPHKIFKGKSYQIVNAYTRSLNWDNLDSVLNAAGQAQMLLLWGLSAQLASDYAVRLHMAIPGEDGLDNYFAKQAIASGKQQSSLDSSDVIAKLNNYGKLEDLAKGIEKLVKGLKKGGQLDKTVFNTDYVNLKIKYQFGRKMPKDIDDAGLGTARNNKWMHKLDGPLRTEDCFIAVGLGHLNYKNGLIMQLRKAGFKVTPVEMHRITLPLKNS